MGSQEEYEEFKRKVNFEKINTYFCFVERIDVWCVELKRLQIGVWGARERMESLEKK